MEKEKKDVVLLGFTSFFTDFSSDAIMSLLSLYSSSSGLVGVFGGIINGLGSVFKLLFGYLSDILGKRKSLVFFGYALSNFSKILIPFIGPFGTVIVLTIDRIGKGIRTSPRDAILSKSKKRGWAFGLHRALDKIGAIAGSFFAFIIISLGESFKTATFYAGILGLFALLPISFVSEHNVKKSKKISLLESVRNSSKELKRFMIPVFFFSLALVSPMLIIRSSSNSIGNWSILAFSLFNLLYAISAKKFGELSDIWGRKTVLKISFAFTSLGFLFACFSGLFPVLGFIFYGVGIGAWRSTATATASDFAKGTATGIGFFHLVNGIGIFVGSILVGFLLDYVGSFAYIFSVITSLIAFIPLIKCAC